MPKDSVKKHGDWAWAYDIECYPNYFCVVVDSIHDDTQLTFEVWYDPFELDKPVCDLIALQTFFANHDNFVGFNNLSYDDIVMHKALSIRNYDAKLICDELYSLSKSIIANQVKRIPFSERDFKSLDLFRLWHFNNAARSMSLKRVEAAIGFKNIRDLPYDPDEFVLREQSMELLEYCKNDVAATKAFHLYNNPETREDTLAKLKLRDTLSEQYGYDFTNLPDASIGEKIMLSYMSEALEIPSYILRSFKTERDRIDVKDIIFDYIKFDSVELNLILDQYNNLVLPQKFKTTQEFGGVDYVFGLGGLHAAIAGTHESDEDTMILSVDVASYYPNLAIKNRLYPEHLSEKFCEVYESLYDRRKSIPKSNPMNGALKLALNGAYGKSKDKWSFLYDPKFTMSITINGQLLLAMLAERIQLAGGQIIMANTDGLECMINRSDYDKILNICKDWEKLTSLTLEYDEYRKMFVRDVNNYIAVNTDGKVKYKGDFEIEKELHKDHSAKVVRIAVENYVLHGIPVGVTIKNHPKIEDFFVYARCRKTSVLCYEHNSKDVQLQRMNRLLVVDEGHEMYKRFTDGRKISVYKGYELLDCNDMNSIKPFTINYNFYIEEADKLIQSVEKFNNVL